MYLLHDLVQYQSLRVDKYLLPDNICGEDFLDSQCILTLVEEPANLHLRQHELSQGNESPADSWGL